VPEGLRRELQELGLRTYEARAVVALLQVDSANSAELAELAGLPRTSTYEVMAGLIHQGLALRVAKRGPAAWSGVGWAAVLDALDAAEEQRLRYHHTRTRLLRQALAQVLPPRAS